MKTTMDGLAVPRAALAALRAVTDAHEEGVVRAIATPVVAAELRGQAALIRRSAKYGPSDAWMTHKLDRRADELEAGA